MKTLVKSVFGSYLYGTNTHLSDRDYKAVHFVPKNDLLLMKGVDQISKSTKKGEGKNTADDQDFESFSLQKFILHLGKNGDTTFLDLVHTPDSMLLESSPEWEFIRANRSKFYTKRQKSYLGYARKHSQSFVNSSAKMKAVTDLLKFFDSYPDDTKLADVYDLVPESTFSKKYEISNSEAKDKRTYDFCGKKFMASSNISFAKESMRNTYNEYGQRTKDALDSGGINLKSLSHAFRVGFQLEELYTTGDLVFPLKHANWLRDIKLGKMAFKDDRLSEKLEALLDRVEELAMNSSFPEEVEMTFWENWLVSLYN